MWTKITNKDTAEVQLVASTGGIDPNIWTFEELAQPPKDHEHIDPKTKKLVDHRAQVRKNQTAEKDKLKDLIREIMREEGII